MRVRVPGPGGEEASSRVGKSEEASSRKSEEASLGVGKSEEAEAAASSKSSMRVRVGDVAASPSDIPEVRLTEGGKIEIRPFGDHRWDVVSRSRLARDYGAHHPVWERLRELGVKRPLASGRSRPNAERDCHLYTLRLRPADAARLDGLAAKLRLYRSALVMRLVTEAEAELKARTPAPPLVTAQRKGPATTG